jgi:Beta-ketoacyl synthase, N-terminal domain
MFNRSTTPNVVRGFLACTGACRYSSPFLINFFIYPYFVGIIPAAINGSKCGVYIGASTNDYSRIPDIQNQDMTHLDGFFSRGNVNCMAAGRLAYFYNLVGPVMTVDTACSSSLVAIHLAAQVTPIPIPNKIAN